MGTITALRVIAELDHSGRALDEARIAADGDVSWREWVERHGDGAATIARLRTIAEFDVDGRHGRVEQVNHGVWLEHKHHSPQVQEQIREIAYKDVDPLVAQLRERGIDVAPEALEQMFFEVRLDDALRAATLTRDGGGDADRATPGPS